MDVRIQGHWLETALNAQRERVTPYMAAKRMGPPTKADIIYHHISNVSYLNFESLAQLAHAFPTLNVRYIPTGEGTPVL